MLWVFYWSSLNMEHVWQFPFWSYIWRKGKICDSALKLDRKKQVPFLLCLVCYFYRSSKQVPFCTVVFVTPGFERIYNAGTSLKLLLGAPNFLECLTLIRPYCFVQYRGTWASPLVVIPVLCGNRIHPSNPSSLGLSKLEKTEPLKMMLVFFFHSVLSWLTPQTPRAAQHGSGE